MCLYIQLIVYIILDSVLFSFFPVFSVFQISNRCSPLGQASFIGVMGERWFVHHPIHPIYPIHLWNGVPPYRCRLSTCRMAFHHLTIAIGKGEGYICIYRSRILPCQRLTRTPNQDADQGQGHKSITFPPMFSILLSKDIKETDLRCNYPLSLLSLFVFLVFYFLSSFLLVPYFFVSW